MRVRYRCSFNHHLERKIGTEEMRLDQRKSGKPELSIVVIMIDHFRVTQKRKKLPSSKFYRKKITSKM